MTTPLRVLYFGTYERTYPRNVQVISALRRAGVEVIEHHVPVWEDERHKFRIGARSGMRLASAQARLLKRPAGAFDVVIVGYPGHLDMRRARRVAGSRPLVFNPLVSLEDTIVDDRGLVEHASPRAKLVRTIDRRAFRAADLVVADTATHAQFFAERFELPPGRVATCFVGADDALFTPREGVERGPDVLFVGKLIPLHGLDTILAAATRCPELTFHVVGSGQLNGLLARPPANVRWDPWVEYESLPDLYRSAACALGIFGTSAKAARVIPNKVFQALATGTPVVTGDTPAARELLEADQDAALVPPGDADALAAALRRLAVDAALRVRIGARGRRTFEEKASEEVLGAQWRSLLEALTLPAPARASAR